MPPDIKKRTYKGYIIEAEDDPWPLQFKLYWKYYKESDGKMYGAHTVKEAMQEITYLIQKQQIKQHERQQRIGIEGPGKTS